MLLLNENFLFIHIPKTGGTYVTNVLNALADQEIIELKSQNGRLKHSGRNRALDLFSKDKKKVVLLSNIRDPLIHYLSRYNFQWWKRPGSWNDSVKQKYPSFPELSFDEFIDAINDNSLKLKNNNNHKFIQ